MNVRKEGGGRETGEGEKAGGKEKGEKPVSPLYFYLRLVSAYACL